jgi:hypothetical protein
VTQLSKLPWRTSKKRNPVRLTPLLVILLCALLSIRVCVADSGDVSAHEASTISLSTVISTAAQESTYEGSAVEPSITAADPFDFSYFLVLSLGLAGLFWIRKQSQAL